MSETQTHSWDPNDPNARDPNDERDRNASTRDPDPETVTIEDPMHTLHLYGPLRGSIISMPLAEAQAAFEAGWARNAYEMNPEPPDPPPTIEEMEDLSRQAEIAVAKLRGEPAPEYHEGEPGAEDQPMGNAAEQGLAAEGSEAGQAQSTRSTRSKKDREAAAKEAAAKSQQSGWIDPAQQ